MKRLIAAAALACAVMGNAGASGQARGPTTESLISQSANRDDSVTIDALDIPGNSVTAGKYLEILKQKAPSFQYIATPGKWQNVMMPQLTLRKVSLGQAIRLLGQVVPQFEASPNGNSDFANGAEFWTFRDRPEASLFGHEMQLVAFGLNDPIDRLALRKSWSITASNAIAPTPEQIAASRKEALKEILSLLQAAIGQASEPGPEPTLKLHEETGVLLVKGTRGQLNAITQALDALKSGDDPNQYKAKYNRLTADYGNLQERNGNLEYLNKGLEKRNADLQIKLAELQQQLRDLKRSQGQNSTDAGKNASTDKH